MNRIAFLVAVALAGCGSDTDKITQDMTLGGQTIPADLLEEGRIAYQHYCRACHGVHGDGKGPAAAGLSPSPRDFTKGAFKFLSVENGQLPTDDDLKRIVRHGLSGTAMLPWDISQRELNAVVQYIKTFKPECPADKPRDKCPQSRWEKAKKMSEPLPLPPDPYKNDPAGREEAIKNGKRLYHTRGCNTCHPNYVTAKEYYDLTSSVPDLPRELRPEPFLPIVKEAPPFGFILPADFTSRPLRSGDTVEDIFRTITAGVGPMPTWKNVAEKDRWALAHYVHTLVELRHKNQTIAFWSDIEAAAPFTPPPPPPPETQPASQPASQPATQPAKAGAPKPAAPKPAPSPKPPAEKPPAEKPPAEKLPEPVEPATPTPAPQ